MSTLLHSLWPLFALIMLGHLLRRRGFPGDSFWPGAERINYFLLFPALLFNSLLAAPLTDPALFKLGGASLLGLLLGWLLLAGGRRWWQQPAARFGVLVQGSLRFNTYLGLATVSSLFGPEGLATAALLLALMVPMVNVLSVWALTNTAETHPSQLLRPLLGNPLILACILGGAGNLGGLQLDPGSQQLLKLMGAASLPLGLFCVGAALNLGELRGSLGLLLGNSLFRLLAMPGLAWGITVLLQLPSQDSTVLILFFALPCAPSAYVLTRQLKGDSHIMAGLITLQTLLAALSLPLLLWLLAD